MKPTRLELHGFRGIHDGLGRDSLTLEVPDAPLVALSGPNGIGKSTILDNLQPYRLMPSRASEPSPRAFSFYDHVGAEGSKVLDWEHQGIHYQSQIKLKQTAKTKKTEATLLRLDGGQWTPVNHDGILSDGRSDTYDRLISAILGTPALYFATAFFAQNRKALSSYKAGDVKLLLSELLQLNRHLDQSQRAKAVADAISVHLPSLRSHVVNREQYQADLERETQAQATAEQTRQQADVNVTHCRTALSAANRDLAEAQAGDGERLDLMRRREELLSAQTALKNDHVRTEAEFKDQLDAIDQREQATKTDNSNQRRSLNRTLEQLKTAHADKAHLIDTLEQSGATLDADRAKAQATLDAAIAAFDAGTEREQQRTQLQSAIDLLASHMTEAAQAGKHLSAATERVSTQAALCDAVPCQGTDLQERCKLLGDAVQARSTLPDQQAKLAEARERYTQLKAEQGQLKAQHQAIEPTDLIATKAAVESARLALSKLDHEAAQLAQLPALREHLATIASQITDTEQALTQAGQQLEQALEQIATERDQLQQRRQQAQERHETKTQQVQDALDALPPATPDARLAQATQRCTEAEAALSAAETARSDAIAAAANAHAEIQRLSVLVKDMDGYATTITRLEDEIAHWGNLRRGLGRDGIVALCIDDAGPALAGIANDLLDACFSGEYSIELSTQAEKADGTLKEDLEIIVHGKDGARPLRVMSGGQRVFLNEVLSTAIGIYEARHSRGRYHTRLADEVDGALDSDRKLEFAQLKRKALDLAGFEQEVFISHSPEIRDTADEIIDLAAFKV